MRESCKAALRDSAKPAFLGRESSSLSQSPRTFLAFTPRFYVDRQIRCCCGPLSYILVFAFEDIGPQAPTHILIIPRKHFASLNEATSEDHAVIGKMHLVAAELARKLKLLDGYRTVGNSGAGAGQSVFHLHLHLLGGREFSWPPG
jgi:histidine triad (HIT) family protein